MHKLQAPGYLASLLSKFWLGPTRVPDSVNQLWFEIPEVGVRKRTEGSLGAAHCNARHIARQNAKCLNFCNVVTNIARIAKLPYLMSEL